MPTNVSSTGNWGGPYIVFRRASRRAISVHPGGRLPELRHLWANSLSTVVFDAAKDVVNATNATSSTATVKPIDRVL